jgi:aerotaxis receptor
VRHNLPVTTNACALADGEMLVSVTDPQGRITYCNPVFVRISGYSAAELLGQPHNLVRHPDMPEEAFRDLWDTIQSGRPWTGVVKNRCKNGDFYWVRANAAPLTDGERITGYLSVRTRPDPADVQAAEALYARMRDEAANGRLQLRLRHGRLRPGGVAERLALLRQGLGPADHLLLQALAASVAAAAGWALAGQGGAGLLALAGLVMGVAAAAAWALQRAQAGALRPVLAEARRLAAGDLVAPVRTGASGLVGDL